MDLQAKIDALEAKRLQRKGAVDTEREAIAKRLEAMQKEANELQAQSNKLWADHQLEDAEARGEIKALRGLLDAEREQAQGAAFEPPPYDTSGD